MKSSLYYLKTVCMIALLWGIGVISAHAQTLSDYSALPPFIGQAVTPNILLLLDNSASMNESAYHKNGEVYDPSISYGGYFDNTKCYSYASGKFTAGVARAAGSPYCSGGAPWDGNFLNYITMRKIEITKWVMMGGKCAPRVSGNCYPGGMLSAESGSTTNGWDFGIVATPDGASPYTGDRCFERHTGTLYVTKAGTLTTCSTSGLTTDSYSLTTNVSSEPQGIIQQIGNKARFGLMEFQSNLSANGGKVVAGVGDNLTSMVNAIENTNASTWTPLSESLYEAGRYFAQVTPY
jgi:type IV pilus assembly protein PilY1